MITNLIFAAALASANAANNTYLVTFDDPVTEQKARVSLHHALIADQDGGILMKLNSDELAVLKSVKANVIPAQAQAERLFQQFKQQGASKSSSGINGFQCFSTVEETFEQGDALVANYPEYARWVDIGDSWQKQAGGEGFDLKVLVIGKQDLIDPPILFIQSAMHAREYATAQLTLDFAKMLLSDRTSNADIEWLLENQQVHILFQTNPDGRKIAETGILQRKNHNQTHCDNNVVGVDLNRNFSYEWGQVAGGSSGEECSEVFRGPSPGSEPETQAVEQYVRSIFPDSRGPNKDDKAPDNTKGAYLDIHSYSELILWPWGNRAEPAPNQLGLESFGRKLAYFNGYRPMQSIGLYPTDGTSDHLAYNELGIAHITFELGTAFFQDCQTYQDKIKPDNLNALLYAAKVSSAPYMLSQGPDVVDVHVTGSDQSSLKLSATATDLRFNQQGQGVSTQTVSEVVYAINELPNDANQRQAEFIDSNPDSGSEKVSFEVNQETIEDGTATVYLKAKDTSGQWGPVSAFRIDSTPPQLDAQISCEGARCAFKALNQGEAYEYLWHLEDGREQASQEAEFIMPSIGEFNVTYQLRTGFGITTEKVFSFSVTELLMPEVQFTVQCAETECVFDASSSSDSDGETLTYQWDLGDTNLSDEMIVTHNYAEQGDYKVKLQVTDQHQQTVTLEKQVTVFSEAVEKPKKSSSGGTLYFVLALLSFIGVRRRIE